MRPGRPPVGGRGPPGPGARSRSRLSGRCDDTGDGSLWLGNALDPRRPARSRLDLPRDCHRDQRRRVDPAWAARRRVRLDQRPDLLAGIARGHRAVVRHRRAGGGLADDGRCLPRARDGRPVPRPALGRGRLGRHAGGLRRDLRCSRLRRRRRPQRAGRDGCRCAAVQPGRPRPLEPGARLPDARGPRPAEPRDPAVHVGPQDRGRRSPRDRD